MTVIRFARHGTKKRPFFRIVVQDKEAARNGRFIEHIGNFIPTATELAKGLILNKPRLQYWLGVGAQPSTSVQTHLRSVFAEFRLATTPTVRAPEAPETVGATATSYADAKPKGKATVRKET